MNKSVLYKNQVEEIPPSLLSTQKWFAGIITNKLGEESEIQSYTQDGFLIAEEAARYITPRPDFQSHQRIQVYNQQYWWRLLKNMQENFPLLTRLFGYHAFNDTVAIPYLSKYPPNHWSLNKLGSNLSRWIEEDYHAPDKKLVKSAAELDWAFMASFIAPQHQSLDFSMVPAQEQLLSYTFFLQPHIFLFKWNYDLFAFREAFLKEEVDYWIDNDFPSLPKAKNYYFILYRTTKNFMSWKELSAAEYIILAKIQKGSSIEYACEELEKQAESVYDNAVAHIQEWLQDWVRRRWLTLQN